MLPPCQSVLFSKHHTTSSRHTYSQLDSRANAPGPGLGTRSKQVSVFLCLPLTRLHPWGNSCVLLQAIWEPQTDLPTGHLGPFSCCLLVTHTQTALHWNIYFYLAKSQVLHFEKQNLKQPNALPITEEGLATVQNILKLFFYTSRFKMSSVRTKKSTACSLIIEKN